MKLRNKRTGEIVEAEWVKMALPYGHWDFANLESLNEQFEDYAPKEPLIKDEKIRKAVRAWAEATGTKSVSYWGHLESCQNDASIDLQNRIGLKNGDDYTIAELCGTPEPLEPTFIDLDEQTKEKEEK